MDFRTSLTVNGKNVVKPSTFVVAASNSLNKDQADFVGTGSGDQSLIDSAINAAPDVTFLEGTVGTDITALVTGSNVTMYVASTALNDDLSLLGAKVFVKSGSMAGQVGTVSAQPDNNDPLQLILTVSGLSGAPASGSIIQFQAKFIEIRMMSGTYVWSSAPTNNNKSFVSIVGAERGTVITDPSFATSALLLLSRGNSNVTFKNLIFQGSASKSTSKSGAQIQVLSSNLVKFDNCEFSGFSLMIASSFHVDITNCKFAAGRGVTNVGDMISVNESIHVRVTGCQFLKHDRSAIVTYSCSYTKIINNYFRYSFESNAPTIRLVSNQNSIVESNTILDTNAGIMVDSGSQVSAVNNTIKNCRSFGIQLNSVVKAIASHNQIADNCIMDSVGQIFITGYGDDNLISENTIISDNTTEMASIYLTDGAGIPHRVINNSCGYIADSSSMTDGKRHVFSGNRGMYALNGGVDGLTRDSSITIAATDTADKNMANFVCSGSNDQVVINDAINSLPLQYVEDGLVAASSTTTVIKLDTSKIANHDYAYLGCTIKINGSSRTIKNFDTATSSVTLDSALPSAPSTGTTYIIYARNGKIVLRKGTYSIWSSINVPTGVTIEGEGEGTLLYQGDSGTGSVFVVNNASNVTIKNLTINNRAGFTTSNPCNGISLLNLTAYVDIDNVDFNKISANAISNDLYAFNVNVRNCKFKAILGASITGQFNCCSISDNLFDKCAGTVILLQSGAASNTITSNKFVNIASPASYVILLNGAASNVISNNVFNGCSVTTISLNAASWNNITGNVISFVSTATGKYGVYLVNSSSSNVVQGNSFMGMTGANCYAVWCSGFGNSISTNMFFQVWTGIYVEGSNQTVSGNSIRKTNRNNIMLAAATYCIVSDNLCVSASTDTLQSYDSILLANNSNYNTVQGNKIYEGTETNKPRYAIYISVGCAGNKITDNDVISPTGMIAGTIVNNGTSTITTSGNRTNPSTV